MQEILDSPELPNKQQPGKAYRVIRAIEMPLLVVFMAGLTFRLMSWPGGLFMLLVSVSLLSLVYFMSWLAPVIDKRSPLSIGYAVAVSLALSTGVIGVLFRFMSWPGSTIQLMAGAILGGACLLIAMAVQLLQSKFIHKQVVTWTVWRLIPIIAWTTFYLFTLEARI